MQLFYIPPSIQNTSVLNGAVWDMEQVDSGICEIGLLHPLIRTIFVKHGNHKWTAKL